MALTDFTIDTSGTAKDVQRRQALADALMKQGGDSTPAAGGVNGGWLTALNRGLAGALGGYQQGQMNQQDQANRQSERDLLASYPGANPVASQGTIPQALSKAAPSPDTSGKIYNNDEPSPLDPPSGADRQKMMATILGEAGNEPQLGKNAVASVIRTRAVDGGYGGDTPSGVVTAPNQFEPWNTPEGRARMARALADPQQAAAADAAIKAAYGEGGKAPEDPTEGMTHFYSPAGQAALGRSKPAWAGGESVTIGGHVFNSPDEGGIPQNAQAAQGALPTQTQVAQADPQAGRRQELTAWAQKALLSSNPQVRQMAVQTLEQMNKPDTLMNAGGGKLYNQRTGQWISAPETEEDASKVKSLTPGGELYHMENGKVVVDHKNDKNVNAEDVPQATIDFLADRVRMGDPAVKIGYARNPGVIAKIDSTAQQREDAGIPVSDAARNVVGNKVTLSARGSAERKLGTINTNNEFYGNNALGALDIAEKASAEVPRTNYPGVNKALNAYRTGTGDPKTVALGAALNTVVNDYAKFTGGGVGTDSLRGHAEEILNGAHSHEQLQSIVHMMRTEIKRGQQSPGMVREGFDDLYAPHGSAGGASPKAAPLVAPAAAPAAPAAKAPPGVGEVIKGHKFLGGDPANPASWAKVEEKL